LTTCRHSIQIWTIVITVNVVGVIVVIIKEKSPPNIPSRICLDKGSVGTFIIALDIIFAICLTDMIITSIDSTGINLEEICVGTIFVLFIFAICLTDMIITSIDSTGINLEEICVFTFAGRPRSFKGIFLVGLKCAIKLSS
jgi:hypothetical protein